MANPASTTSACEHCGAPFEPKTSRSRYCNRNCSRLADYYRHHDRRKATTRAWQSANAGRWRETKRQWGQQNCERKLDALRRFYARNPQAVTIDSNRRRQAKLTNTRGVGVTTRDLQRLITRYRGRCAYCDVKPDRLHIDHVVPLVRGGSDLIGNLLPACPPCNLSKNSKLLTEWRLQQRYRLAA